MRLRTSMFLALVPLALTIDVLLAGCGPAKAPPPVPRTAAARGAFQFVDITAAAGIHWRRANGAFGKKWMPETLGGGGAFLDYDKDGFLDILQVNGDWWSGHALPGARPALAVYHNNHNGTFTDVTAAVGLNVSVQGMGVAVGDFDNDGYDDVYITGVGGNRLFHNESGKRFTDITKAAGVGGAGWSTSAAWVDYDNDGKLDLFVCHYVRWSPATDLFCGAQAKSYCTPTHYHGESCRLYHNDGGGHFSDVTAKAGLFNANAKALGVCTVDFDHDGRVDILVANDQVANFAYHNNGDGTFKDVSLESGLATEESGEPRAGMGIDAADTMNDGRLAVLVGNFSTQGVGYYREVQPGLFHDDAQQAKLMQPSYPYVTFGVLFCDFDNSGWKDALITNGHVDDLISQKEPTETYVQPTLVFANRRDGTFDDVTAASGPGVATRLVGRGACWGDFDNDGRPDLLLVPNVGPPCLLHNETPASGHWITIVTEGVRTNRDGFGAQVRVTSGGVSQSDIVRGGSSYCSQSDRRLHFGLGTAETAETVEVRWPSGRRDVHRNIAANHIWKLKEGSPPAQAQAMSR